MMFVLLLTQGFLHPQGQLVTNATLQVWSRLTAGVGILLVSGYYWVWAATCDGLLLGANYFWCRATYYWCRATSGGGLLLVGGYTGGGYY